MWLAAAVLFLVSLDPVVGGAAAPCAMAAAPDGQRSAADKPPETKSLIDFILAGRYVGAAIIALSFVGVALAIDSFLHIRLNVLVPPLLARQVISLAREARLGEIVRLSRASDSLLGRVLARVMVQRPLSLASARESLQEAGTTEVTRLQHRVGFIGFIAVVAPMLGLLGTVTGMIYAFNILGTLKTAARADELAVGVSEALVATCEGLIVAIPMMFFHLYFRTRVTRIGQEAAAVCDSVMRGLAAVVEARTTGRPVQYDLRDAADTDEEIYEIVEGIREDEFLEGDESPRRPVE
jgi:biopolymer transport protein ExbB